MRRDGDGGVLERVGGHGIEALDDSDVLRELIHARGSPSSSVHRLSPAVKGHQHPRQNSTTGFRTTHLTRRKSLAECSLSGLIDHCLLSYLRQQTAQR